MGWMDDERGRIDELDKRYGQAKEAVRSYIPPPTHQTPVGPSGAQVPLWTVPDMINQLILRRPQGKGPFGPDQ